MQVLNTECYLPQLRNGWCFIICPHRFVEFLVMSHRQADGPHPRRHKPKKLLAAPTLKTFNWPCFWSCLERHFPCRPPITHCSHKPPKQRSEPSYWLQIRTACYFRFCHRHRMELRIRTSVFTGIQTRVRYGSFYETDWANTPKVPLLWRSGGACVVKWSREICWQ
jgi:hypothetical protein